MTSDSTARGSTRLDAVKAVFAALAFAVYPVLFLYAHNQEQTYTSDLLRPLVVTFAVAVGLLGLFALVFRDPVKAGLAVVAFVALFFAYGHIVGLFPEPTPAVTYGTLGVEAALLVAAVVALWRARRPPAALASVLAAVAAILLAFPLVTIATGALGKRGTRESAPAAGAPAGSGAEVPAGRLPDIYYIVLDSYGSGRSLQEFYGYDNGPFLDELRSRGFRVTPDSRSNYGQTLLSMSSSLNMTYLDEMTAKYRGTSERTVLMDAVRDSAVVRELKRRGYRFVNISSGFSGTDPMPSADVELRAPRGTLSEFEVLLAGTTPLVELPLFRETTDAFLLRRYAVLHAFETLADLPELPQPKFVLAHILSPHPPFVFDREGGMREKKGRFNRTKYTKQEYVDGYRGQVEFVNSRLLPAIDAILARYPAGEPPVIVIQGDHGPRSLRKRKNTSEEFYRERFSILNAYLVPPALECSFHDSISPVNSFRALFGCLFGEPLPLLRDESYFSTSSRPFDFRSVSEIVGSGVAPEGDDDGDHDTLAPASASPDARE